MQDLSCNILLLVLVQAQETAAKLEALQSNLPDLLEGELPAIQAFHDYKRHHKAAAGHDIRDSNRKRPQQYSSSSSSHQHASHNGSHHTTDTATEKASRDLKHYVQVCYILDSVCV